MSANLPSSKNPRIVIIGAGFAGLRVARKLANKPYQVVLIDKNNYHQFQPLFYQVATAGLEPSSISFPLRKAFQHIKNVHVRVGKVNAINHQEKEIDTDFGAVDYDELIISIGADTNFFGMENIEKNAIPMKSVSEALFLRNRILQNFEKALSVENPAERKALMTLVVVGGGPTGVEVSGTLAEMKKVILPKDYPELDFEKMEIHLIEASGQLLNGMSTISSSKSKEYLERLGVKVQLNGMVKNFEQNTVFINDDIRINTHNLIWAAGIIGNTINGIPQASLVKGNRLKVNQFNQIQGLEGVYALGDIAYMESEEYSNGHPQVAQVAIQMADIWIKNLFARSNQKPQKLFRYKDLGSMATVGRNLAVVELPYTKFQGFLAWLFWMLVHIMQIVGVKNKVFIFINWVWNYITYDQSLRLIIKPKVKHG